MSTTEEPRLPSTGRKGPLKKITRQRPRTASNPIPATPETARNQRKRFKKRFTDMKRAASDRLGGVCFKNLPDFQAKEFGKIFHIVSRGFFLRQGGDAIRQRVWRQRRRFWPQRKRRQRCPSRKSLWRLVWHIGRIGRLFGFARSSSGFSLRLLLPILCIRRPALRPSSQLISSKSALAVAAPSGHSPLFCGSAIMRKIPCAESGGRLDRRFVSKQFGILF